MKRLLFTLAAIIALAVPSLAQTGAAAQITGNITATGANACATAGSCVILQLPPGASSVSVVVSGTYSATLQFEQSADNRSSFTSATATPQPPATTVTSTTSTGTWVIPVAGMTHVQVRASAYTSGTAQVTITSSAAEPSNTTLVNLAALPAGTNSIGTVLLSNPCFGGALTSTVVSLSGTTATQIIAISGATKVYVCSFTVGNGSGTTPTFSLEYGTGSNCGTGTTVILPAVAIPAGTAAPLNFPQTTFFVTPAGQALCYILTGTTPTGTLIINTAQQ